MPRKKKLSLTSSQRKALLRNQATALIQHGKIVTTQARAKEVRKIRKSKRISLQDLMPEEKFILYFMFRPLFLKKRLKGKEIQKKSTLLQSSLMSTDLNTPTEKADIQE